MSRYAPAARPLVQCLRASTAPVSTSVSASTTTASTTTASILSPHTLRAATRCFATTPATGAAAVPAPPAPPTEELLKLALDPDTATVPWAERELMRRGTPPVGSRRRRAAQANAAQRGFVPFELMPYQCFQEARAVLKADRDEKLAEIAVEAGKVRKLESVLAAAATDPGAVTSRGGVPFLQRRLASLRTHLERLKVLADINDPLVKRRFEDGQGDMDKPIYRHLAEQRWRGRPLRLASQRAHQFHLAPDLVAPSQLHLSADLQLFFRSFRVANGDIVDSLISEVTPRLRLQVFDRGTRLVSVVVVDADVPDLATDTYTRRCHYLAANIPVGPTSPSVVLSRLDKDAQVALPWLPAFAQKGSPAHRLAVFVLEHPRDPLRPDHPGEPIDVAKLQALARDGFSVRHYINNNKLNMVACSLFRTEWDAGTAGVMERAGIPGADLELKATRLPSLKPPRKARGWEAKHQGPKYRHLWKYTHRIATPKRKFVR